MRWNCQWSLQLILIVGIIAVFSTYCFVDASGKTITVDDDGEADYPTIQDAIRNASSGDTIRVWAGSYEKAYVNVSVHLIGNGSDQTTIRGVGRDGSIVHITANSVFMSGFKIGGLTSPEVGISVIADDVTIKNNYISSTKTGIRLRESENGIIKDNHCVSNYEGISVWKSDGCEIDNNSLNVCKFSMYLSNSMNCTVTNNSCKNSDEGLRLWDSFSFSIIHNYYSKNEIGIKLRNSSNSIISNNTFEENDKDIVVTTMSNFNRISFNAFENNTEYAIDASENEGVEVNATNNWWGSNSGPLHLVNNPQGTGDNVTDLVKFDPWTVRGSDIENQSNGDDFIHGFELILLLFSFGIISGMKRKRNNSS